MANYSQKCWNYLFRGKYYLGEKSFIFFYSGSLILAAVVEMSDIVNFIDIAFALMAIPNIISVVYLASKVKVKLKEYNIKYKV